MNINNVCKNEPLTIDNSEFTIVNETSVCNNVAEPFYDDAKYHYLFECERSNTTFVKFIDGTKMSIKDALNDNLVTILQIQDKLKTIPNNKIKIIKKLKIDIDVNPSNKCEIKPMITKEMSSTYKAMDYNLYTYCLDELNITIDNEKFNLRDALATGEVDLENIVDYMEFGSKWAEATKEEYDDGAVKYSNLKFSLLKCNNDLNEYYIGKNDMSYDKNFCK